jgi:iron(III) transport system substrate-binding protein
VFLSHDRGRVAAVLTLSMLALSACSAPAGVEAAGEPGGAESVYESFDGMPEGERMEALVEAAEGEGKVVAHLRSDDVATDIEKAFEEKYDIDLVILNPGTTQVVSQQVFEEARAGRMGADVVEVMSYEVEKTFAAEGVVAALPRFIGEAAAKPELVAEYGVETHSYPFPVYWNTDAVTGGDIPTSLEDLDNPRWDGRLIMMTTNFHWYMTVFQTLVEDQGMPVGEFEALMKGIAQRAETTNSSNPAAQGMASGQYWATPSGAMVAFQRVQGAPVGFDPAVEPVQVVPAHMGLMKDAPHPAAAQLFMHWYLTEGLDVTVEEHFFDYHEKETDLKGVEVRRLQIDDLTAERIAEWRAAYDNLLSGRDPVVPEYVRGS